MSENCQRHRTAWVSASALIVATIVVSIVYFTLPSTWLARLCELLLFPAIAAIAGGLAIVWAGELVVNRWLERYKERSGYGLAKRKLFLDGDPCMIRSIRDDLLISDLINHKNYTDPNIDVHDADIAILCISKTYKTKEKEDPDNPGGHKVETPEYASWKKEAKESIERIMAQLRGNQALIVFTNGWLDTQTKNDIEERSFSTLVNFRGRIVSDIHSLLTTLPPRNGD